MLLRSLQVNQPKIITVFSATKVLKPHWSGSAEVPDNEDGIPKFKFENRSNFPTREQLQYMVATDAGLVAKQFPNLKLGNPPYNKSLQECAELGWWRPHHALYVDWEGKRMRIESTK